MALGYNLNIPFENDNPSDDQPLMKENTNSISTIINVDHQTFTSSDYGTHTQCTFANTHVPGGLTSDPKGIAYPGPGVASPAHTQFYWVNSQAFFPLSAIRAFVNFSTLAVAAGTQTLTPNIVWNVTGTPNSINQINTASTTKFEITLTTNAINAGVSTDNILVFFTSDLCSLNTSSTATTVPGYSFNKVSNVLTLNTSKYNPGGALINVMVIQI